MVARNDGIPEGSEWSPHKKNHASSCGGQGSVGLRVGLNMFLFRRCLNRKGLDESHRGP
jgi:hypothetical protein